MFAADRTPPAGRNINYFQDAEVTKTLYASDRTVDQAKRRDLLQAAARRIADLAVEIPLYNTTKIDAVPVTLLNFKGNPTNAGPFWNVFEWVVAGATLGVIPDGPAEKRQARSRERADLLVARSAPCRSYRRRRARSHQRSLRARASADDPL